MIPNPNMTQEEAVAATGLIPRHYPTADKNFLRCQLGRNEPQTIEDPKTGRPMTVQRYRMVGFGVTWGAAVAMVPVAKRMPLAIRENAE